MKCHNVTDAVIVLTAGAALTPILLMGWLDLHDLFGRFDRIGIRWWLALPLTIQWPRDGIIATLRRCHRENNG